MATPRVVPSPDMVRRHNELFDLYNSWLGGGDPDDDPEFVAEAREIMGLPSLDEASDEAEATPAEQQRALDHGSLRLRGILADRRKDVTPGHDELHHYWTKGEGLAKWANSPHPWTALYHHLLKYVGPQRAKRMAAQWHREVFGIWPGEKKGDNPLGPG